ncbi:unnamed protein product, partial [Heterotrigona itama]
LLLFDQTNSNPANCNFKTRRRTPTVFLTGNRLAPAV